MLDGCINISRYACTLENVGLPQKHEGLITKHNGFIHHCDMCSMLQEPLEFVHIVNSLATMGMLTVYRVNT